MAWAVKAGGQDAQRQHARGRQVDPAPGAEADPLGGDEPDEDRDREHDGDEQLLAVAQERQGLEPCLVQHPAAQRCGSAHAASGRVSEK